MVLSFVAEGVMGRKSKPDSLKSSVLACSVPASFKTYFAGEADGPSKALQALIAHRVHGLTLEDFKAAYGEPELDWRYKKDPIEQEFIRVARWILESQVLGVFTVANPCAPYGKFIVGIRVQWLHTGAVTDLLVGLYSPAPGYRRVIYDVVHEDMRPAIPKYSRYQELSTYFSNKEFTPNEQSLDKLIGADNTIQPFKAQILRAWLKHSQEQAIKCNQGAC